MVHIETDVERHHLQTMLEMHLMLGKEFLFLLENGNGRFDLYFRESRGTE